MIAIDSDTQEILWEKNIGGEVLSNAVSASLIIVKNSVGELIALNSNQANKNGHLDLSYLL